MNKCSTETALRRQIERESLLKRASVNQLGVDATTLDFQHGCDSQAVHTEDYHTLGVDRVTSKENPLHTSGDTNSGVAANQQNFEREISFYIPNRSFFYAVAASGPQEQACKSCQTEHILAVSPSPAVGHAPADPEPDMVTLKALEKRSGRDLFEFMQKAHQNPQLLDRFMTLESLSDLLYREYEIPNAEFAREIFEANGPELIRLIKEAKMTGIDWTRRRVFDQLRDANTFTGGRPKRDLFQVLKRRVEPLPPPVKGRSRSRSSRHSPAASETPSTNTRGSVARRNLKVAEGRDDTHESDAGKRQVTAKAVQKEKKRKSPPFENANVDNEDDEGHGQSGLGSEGRKESSIPAADQDDIDDVDDSDRGFVPSPRSGSRKRKARVLTAYDNDASPQTSKRPARRGIRRVKGVESKVAKEAVKAQPPIPPQQSQSKARSQPKESSPQNAHLPLSESSQAAHASSLPAPLMQPSAASASASALATSQLSSVPAQSEQNDKTLNLSTRFTIQQELPQTTTRTTTTISGTERATIKGPRRSDKQRWICPIDGCLFTVYDHGYMAGQWRLHRHMVEHDLVFEQQQQQQERE